LAIWQSGVGKEVESTWQNSQIYLNNNVDVVIWQSRPSQTGLVNFAKIAEQRIFHMREQVSVDWYWVEWIIVVSRELPACV
jgi:hypothetical protein